MNLIGCYRNARYTAVADGVMAFFERRADLRRGGVAFGPAAAAATPARDPAEQAGEPATASTDITLVAINPAIRKPSPSRR